MVGRVGKITRQVGVEKLRVYDNEVFRQTGSTQQPAILVGIGIGGVQPVGKASYIVIDQMISGRAIEAYHVRACDILPINKPEIADIQPHEDFVKQGRVSAGLRDEKCVQDSRLKDVDFIDIDGARELRTFIA